MHNELYVMNSKNEIFSTQMVTTITLRRRIRSGFIWSLFTSRRNINDEHVIRYDHRLKIQYLKINYIENYIF